MATRWHVPLQKSRGPWFRSAGSLLPNNPAKLADDLLSCKLVGRCQELQTYILGIFRGLCLVQPSLEKGLQLAHVLEAQLQSLEAADGCLAEHFTYTET